MYFGKKAKYKKKLSISALICAFTIVGLYILGVMAKDTVIDQKSSIGGSSGLIAILGFLIIGTAALTVFFSVLFQWIDKVLSEKTVNSSIDANRTSVVSGMAGKSLNPVETSEYMVFGRMSVTRDSYFHRLFLHLVRILLLCWIPYLVIRFPGNLDPDTEWELLQSYGLIGLIDHHPIFDTLFFGVFWKLGDLVGSNSVSLLVYAAFQYIMTASVFAFSIVYVLKFSGSMKTARLIGYFYALYPLIPAFSMTMAKDMLNGWVFIIFFLLYLEAIRTNGWAFHSTSYVIWLVVISVICCMTKKTSLYIILPSLLILLFCYRKNIIRMLLSMAMIVILFEGLWTRGVIPALHAGKGESREVFSVPSQQVAYYIRMHREEMTSDDWEILEGVYDDPATLPDVYVPVRADNTKARWREDSTSAQRRAFYGWYIRAFMKHPKDMVFAFFANSYPLYCIDSDTEGDESLIFYRDNVSSASVLADETATAVESWLADVGGCSVEKIRQLFGSAYRPVWISRLSAAADTIFLNMAEGLPLLFSKVLFTTWIPLTLLFYAIHSRSKALFVGLMPALLTTLSIALGPIALPRYMVSPVYMAPLLIAMPVMFRRVGMKKFSENNISTKVTEKQRRKK